MVVDGVDAAMIDPWTMVGGRLLHDVLVICDHASNDVPPGIDLGIDRRLLSTHIGWDIGVATLARAIGAPAFLGNVSRLVVDFNRDPTDTAIVPKRSDGHDIPGNRGTVSDRIARYWQPYHEALSALIARTRPALLVSLHSFTPVLASRPNEHRPWEVGILYGNDDRAARIAIPLLASAGVVVGDQLPYSGKDLNATMNRHAETSGMPYLGIEMRQDLIADDAGVSRWSPILRATIATCLDHFTAGGTEDE